MAVLDPQKLIPHSRLDSSHTESLIGIKVKVISAKNILKGTLAEEKVSFKDTKRIDEAKERRHYKKPYEKKREAKRRAIARQKKEEAKRKKYRG